MKPGAVVLALVVTYCVTCWVAVALAQETPRYTVRKGDSLSLVAKKLGTTVAHLRRSNGLKSDVIHVGQDLSVPDAFKGLKPGDVRWSRPLPKGGRTVRPFGNYQQGKLVLPSTGADIACAAGTRVTAPASGIVRHVGAMDGVGIVVILEHGGSYTSVLAPLDAAIARGRARPDRAAGRCPRRHGHARIRSRGAAPARGIAAERQGGRPRPPAQVGRGGQRMEPSICAT